MSQGMPPMICRERHRLEQEQAEIGAALDWAQRELRARAGARHKHDAFLRLRRAVDIAENALNRVRDALHAHIRQHRCTEAAQPAKHVN